MVWIVWTVRGSDVCVCFGNVLLNNSFEIWFAVLYRILNKEQFKSFGTTFSGCKKHMDSFWYLVSSFVKDFVLKIL